MSDVVLTAFGVFVLTRWRRFMAASKVLGEESVKEQQQNAQK